MAKLCTTCKLNLRFYGDLCRRCFFAAYPPKPQIKATPVTEDLPEDSPLRRLRERAEQELPLWEELNEEK